jgi:hypothetical protein
VGGVFCSRSTRYSANCMSSPPYHHLVQSRAVEDLRLQKTTKAEPLLTLPHDLFYPSFELSLQIVCKLSP